MIIKRIASENQEYLPGQRDYSPEKIRAKNSNQANGSVIKQQHMVHGNLACYRFN